MTAINGPGNLRAWQQGIPAPLSSVVNYNANGESGDVANTTIIPALQDVADPNEIQFQADVNGTHIVVDVVGYFWSPNATALNCTTVTNSVAVPNNTQIDFPPGLVSPACPAGFTLTGGGNLYSGAVSGFWWWNSHPVGNTWVTAGRNLTGAGANVTVYATCCRVPGR